MASCSSSPTWEYDVFLSFRGKDTRLGFTSHLHDALKRSGIRVFMDDSGIIRGKEISDSLEQAIETSRIVLVILSPDYASSKWCLDELVKIMMEPRVTQITPIFYNVDPSDVRHQRGTYRKAMEEHELTLGKDSCRVLQWKEALTRLADVRGFSYSEFWHRENSRCVGLWHSLRPRYVSGFKETLQLQRNLVPESELIDKIVEDVSRKLGIIKSPVHKKTVIERSDYNVFLSFRPEDTGLGFTHHLYRALARSEIHTFMETTWINGSRKDEEIIFSSSLQEIERSRIALVILSPNYAYSRQCLDELVKIMECHQRINHQLVVIPIFYEVNHEKGTFDEAIKQHNQRFFNKREGQSKQVVEWNIALAQIVNIKGYFSYTRRQHRSKGPTESELIEIIVEDVSRKLGDRLLFATKHQGGIESRRVQEVTRVKQFNYDVLLSYRSKDTGRGFTAHLRNALRQIKIHAFMMMDIGMETGNWVAPSLLQAIERSPIVIIIFSLHYASSTWCMKELVKIMERQMSHQAQVVIPIYYNIDPSDVHFQNGTIGKAMEQHEIRFGSSGRVLRWSQVLTKLADVQGFSYTPCQYRNDNLESNLIENIVAEVSRKLGRGQLSVANHPVGQVHELGFSYNVFLSFRGEDTGSGFASHLYNALRRIGIDAFMDKERIQMEAEIFNSWLHVIEGSMILLVIFSPHYAHSHWCLDELMKIVKCEKTLEYQVVMPIFYEVDPSDVRHQRGSYGEAMELHQQRLGRENDWVLKSRKALKIAADKAGFDSSTCRNDCELIENIVRDVSKKLSIGQLSVTKRVTIASASTETSPPSENQSAISSGIGRNDESSNE